MCSGQLTGRLTYSPPIRTDGCDKIMNDVSTHTQILNHAVRGRIGSPQKNPLVLFYFIFWKPRCAHIRTAWAIERPQNWVRLTGPQ